MLKQDYLMIVAMEECAEIAQAISKCIRFGIDSMDRAMYNREYVCGELDDLIAVLEMLKDDCNIDFLEGNETNKQNKKDKVNRFMPADLK